MSVGDQNYQTGMTMGRIEFAPRDPVGFIARVPLHDPLSGMAFIKPGYTVEKPKFAPRPFPSPIFHWLIEVCFDGDSRAPRYFTGECEAGWVGCTTIRADLAQKYSSKEAAENDIAKLAPRLIGKWVAREHGFS